MSLLWIVLSSVAALMFYVRLAPSDIDRWHSPPIVRQDSDGMNSARRLVQTGTDGVQRFADVALASPRTKVLAGSTSDGMITFVTRSALMGYPDYTTVQQDGDTLKVFGRSRFGRKDFGVNAARVDQWVGAL